MVSKKWVEMRIGSPEKLMNVIDNRINPLTKTIAEGLLTKRNEIENLIGKEDITGIVKSFEDYNNICQKAKHEMIEMLQWMHKIELSIFSEVRDLRDKVKTLEKESKDKDQKKVYSATLKKIAQIVTIYNNGMNFEAKLERDIKRSTTKLRNITLTQTLHHQSKVIRNALIQALRNFSEFHNSIKPIQQKIQNRSLDDEKIVNPLIHYSSELMRCLVAVYRSLIILTTDLRDEYENLAESMVKNPRYKEYYPSLLNHIKRKYKNFQNELERKGRFLRREAKALKI